MVHEICSFAETPDFWLQGDCPQNYASVQSKIRQKYPFLSDGAVVRIATSAAYGWK